MGFRRWRPGPENLFLGPEILDGGEKHLRIARELLQHTQMIRQRHHGHRTARLSLLQHILQHLGTSVGLILKRRIRGVDEQYSRNATRGQILGMVGKNSSWRGCRGGAIRNAWWNKNGNLLLFAIFFDREVFGLQARERLAVLVGYDHIHDDEPRIRANRDGRNIGWRLLGT